MNLKKSEELFNKAINFIPGGVNSPVRAFRAVGGVPIFISKAKGAKIYDVDGNEYIDFVCSWGPLILGHRHKGVIEEIKLKLEDGTTFGAPTKQEIDLAEKIREIFPSIDMVRLVSSGTEATMSAIRLARGYTGKDKIVKFEGCYHGHVDSLLVKSGSGSMTFGIPTSQGIQKAAAHDTIVLPFNDIELFEKLIKENHQDIAAVIMEPVPGNMGVIIPREGYLKAIRDITEKYNILLIFDEVISGFRLAPGGAQEKFNIKADLTCLGKIIGGGLPVGAYGGKKEIMECISPLGGVYQAGTLSGNPLAVAAGLATINILIELEKNGLYRELEQKTENFSFELRKIAEAEGVNITINQIGSMLTVFFTDKPVFDYSSAKTASEVRYALFFWKMLEEGIYLPPSQYEAMFMSIAHREELLKKTLDASSLAFKEIKKQNKE
ncbi:MAG: glutamate-1-semialdehyde 2,1-aminomutase [Candidatus Eremiobacterota bacterium]